MRFAAHPRSRGEHISRPTTARASIGSSPLARGTRSVGTCHVAVSRLIPARAGNTVPMITPPSVHTAHPRSRGEHEEWLRGGKVHFGSSPLARGTLYGFFLAMRLLRLIPARAGNTSPYPRANPNGQAHPRSRGEHVPLTARDPRKPGSSPLARGTHHVVLWRYYCARLIPARAGNTAEFR